MEKGGSPPRSTSPPIRGSPLDDILLGFDGNDTLIGGASGGDEFNGGDGQDTASFIASSAGVVATLVNPANISIENLTGSRFNDTLTGDGAANVMTGGLGRDSLFGGAGRDDFDFNSITETKKGGSRDRIMDFKRGQDDIDLSTIDATKGGSGHKFKWIGKDGFSDEKGELRYEDKGSTVVVQGDVNGNGKADFEIFVSVGGLSKGDFVL